MCVQPGKLWVTEYLRNEGGWGEEKSSELPRDNESTLVVPQLKKKKKDISPWLSFVLFSNNSKLLCLRGSGRNECRGMGKDMQY